MGYIKRDDKYIEVNERGKPQTKNQLAALRDGLFAQVAESEGVNTLTLYQAAFVHRAWEAYRDPLQKGQLTWEQAVKNALARTRSDLTELDELLKE